MNNMNGTNNNRGNTRRFRDDQYDDNQYDNNQYTGNDYAEDEYIEDEYVEDEYNEGDYAEDEYSDGEYAEDGYSDGEYTEDGYSDEQYSNGQRRMNNNAAAINRPQVRRSGHNEAIRRKKQKKMAKLKVLWILFFVIVFISAVVVFVVSSHKDAGLSVTPDSSKYASKLTPGYLSEASANNYYAYLKKSYIMIGSYPDCNYVKIVSDVERNNYNPENYYIPDGTSFMNYYEDGAAKGRVAIDVSSYQKSIDWPTVKAAGVDVALVRVGYRGYEKGTIADDTMFVSHAQGASAAGLELGVYFFTEAINYDEGVEEANYVLSKIGGYNITQPVIIDTEYIYNVEARANDIDNTSRTDAVIGFCDTIAAAGYTPMIYGSRNWFAQNLEISRLGKYEFWLAHYSNQPDFPYHYSGWQYTGEGTVTGIANQVDLNVWFR